jgi:hypothetical protein
VVGGRGGVCWQCETSSRHNCPAPSQHACLSQFVLRLLTCSLLDWSCYKYYLLTSFSIYIHLHTFVYMTCSQIFCLLTCYRALMDLALLIYMSSSSIHTHTNTHTHSHTQQKSLFIYQYKYIPNGMTPLQYIYLYIYNKYYSKYDYGKAFIQHKQRV